MFCYCTGFSQTDPNAGGRFNYLREINSNKYDSLMKFIKGFKTITFPFEFSKPNDETVIDIKLMQHLFDFDINQEDLGYGNYYYGYVFYNSNYVGLIITRYYTPGAFGINNYFVELFTLNDEGKLIDSEELGCFCHDTNMGSNDYYSTELKIVVDSNKIIVNKRNIHATLIEKENESGYEDVTTSIYQIDISAFGEISKSREE
jgi:hypothetical protein